MLRFEGNLFKSLLKGNETNCFLSTTKRFINSNNNVAEFVANRNPRNLERLRIARKPTGYHLDKKGGEFWHKLVLIRKPRYVVAKVIHNNGNTIVQASTNEWGINRHLYRANDVSAYVNLARVLADRCLESGIQEMVNGIVESSHKNKDFVKTFEEAGITLSEPPVYKPSNPWTKQKDEKPWTVHAD